jgi:uncharacterized integral membrane protein (TIGR00698 family)
MKRMRIAQLAPGIALCAALSGFAIGLQMLEEHWTGRPYLEALVIAILLGTVVRTAWTPGERFVSGIGFSAKMLLEIAVMLLGASISFQAVMQAGPSLLIGIAAVVAVALCASYGLCRFVGLPKRMAVLVACGNSICGNSAIAAVAPIIGAKAEDIASSIAFTAVLGVIVVLSLPFLVPALGLSDIQYGVLAGLTVYAVPQVLAATLAYDGAHLARVVIRAPRAVVHRRVSAVIRVAVRWPYSRSGSRRDPAGRDRLDDHLHGGPRARGRFEGFGPRRRARHSRRDPLAHRPDRHQPRVDQAPGNCLTGS